MIDFIMAITWWHVTLFLLGYSFIGMTCFFYQQHNSLYEKQDWWFVIKGIFAGVAWPVWLLLCGLRLLFLAMVFGAMMTADFFYRKS